MCDNHLVCYIDFYINVLARHKGDGEKCCKTKDL